jgi:hypothetical protein
MNNNVTTTRSDARKRTKRIVITAALVVIVVGGVFAWTSICPCTKVRGFVLLGPMHNEPVKDWTFVNDVPLCQLQVSTSQGPYAINLNCMSTGGELYVSCSNGQTKYWCKQVQPNAPGRLRLNGVVYPVVLNRVLDQAELERVWSARVKKLQVYGATQPFPVPAPDAKRPATWWTFHLRSANM